MPASIALWLCVLFVLWLINCDIKDRGKVSAAIWIPLAWTFIISSRPVSVWLGINSGAEGNVDGLQDRLIDKILLLSLIAAGMFVLSARHANWHRIIQDNKWIFVYFLYLGLSVLWSDDSFTSFKRWIKDCGNIVMVFIVLSEERPSEAVRIFLRRLACLLIPLSALLLKYYPQLCRNYDQWTNQPITIGIATDKNTFGMALFVCGVSLWWQLLELRNAKGQTKPPKVVLGTSLLLVLTVWLLSKAQSATALSCALLGCGIIWGLRFPLVKRQVKWIEVYLVGIGVSILLLQATGLWTHIFGQFAEAVGRDSNFHGRAEIWEGVLKEDINPLTGVGFYSFWSVERNRRISEGFYYFLGTAHNGYIETYLNTGLIGVTLLAVVIASAIKRIKKAVISGVSTAPLRLVFLFTIVIYNITESAFDRLVPAWFIMLLIMLEYPHSQTKRIDEKAKNILHGNPSGATWKRASHVPMGGMKVSSVGI